MNFRQLIVAGGFTIGLLISTGLMLICAPVFAVLGGLLLGWILGMVLIFVIGNMIYDISERR